MFQRSDGRWGAALRLAGQSRRYVYATTRDGVQKKLRALLSAQDDGHRITSPTRQKFAAYLRQWLEHMTPRVRPNTLRSYKDVIELHVIPPIGDIRLTALEPYDIERALTRAIEKKLSARTVSYIRQVMFMALKKAVQWEKIKKNPAESISPPKRVRPDIHPLTADELQAFICTITDHEYRALFLLDVTLGLRMGELRGLKWADLEETKGAPEGARMNPTPRSSRVSDSTTDSIIHIRRTLQGKLELPPKTESSKRDLQIPAGVLPVLKEWRVKQLEWRMKAGEKWEDRDSSRKISPSEIP